jgi:hypothetical protein
MYQAIETKYFGPTNTRGSKVKARCQAKTIFVPWDHRTGIEENHIAAAKKLAEQLEWKGRWHSGFGPDQTGFHVIERDKHRGPRFVTKGRN